MNNGAQRHAAAVDSETATCDRTPIAVSMFGHCYLVHVGPLVAALKRTRPDTVVTVEETVLTPSASQSAEWNLLAAKYGVDAYVTPPITPAGPTSLLSRIRNRMPQLPTTPLSPAPLRPRNSKGDLFHLHWPSPHSKQALRSVPLDKPLVVSFWGQDVLDGACLATHEFQRRVIARADIVTVRSIDLREHLFSKFGRECSPKIRIAKFANDMFREKADLCLPQMRADFRARHGISEETVVIAVGHSGYRKDNHVAVIESLRGLRVPNRDLLLMLPMTYGSTEAYRHEVKRAADGVGIRSIVLDTFTDRKGVWEVRAAADVFVSVPDEDAFSAAMCEFMLAGAVAIVGDWLPYGALRRLSVHHRSVETIADVKTQILAAISDLPAERQKVVASSEKLRSEVDIDTTIAGWWAAYDDAIAIARRKRTPSYSLPQTGRSP